MTRTTLLAVPSGAGCAATPAAHNDAASTPPRPAPSDTCLLKRSLRQRYLAMLTALFTLFNAVRVLAYLPTLWAIVQSGDSSQHSLWTWFTWTGANLTMAAWLYEQQGRRWSRAMAVNLANATMCTATLVVIVVLRM